MKRVLKKGGKLVVWDMEAVEESLRTIDDKIENLLETGLRKCKDLF